MIINIFLLITVVYTISKAVYVDRLEVSSLVVQLFMYLIFCYTNKYSIMVKLILGLVIVIWDLTIIVGHKIRGDI